MYERAKRPEADRWIVVFDDLVNLISTNPELTETIKQCASLGAGVGVTTIVSTQFTGKDSGGVAMTANATARLMFKRSSNLQGARDGGMAGLGLDQLSTAKDDALLVVDGGQGVGDIGEQAKAEISQHFSTKQQNFLEFVLAQYIKVGVEELANEKLSPLLKLRYNNAISDALAELGKPDEIARMFVGFQRYLYRGVVAA